MTKKILFILTLLSLQTAHSALLIPNDYEQTHKFFKIVKEVRANKTIYKFHECSGTQKQAQCDQIFDPYGYSKTELNGLERAETLKGTGLLAAEIITGGILWKRLMKFTLGAATKVARKVTGWHEGVANGTIALVATATANASATVVILDKTNDLITAIDPFDKFKKSELIDTDEFSDKKAIVPLNYSAHEAYLVLAELLAKVN